MRLDSRGMITEGNAQTRRSAGFRPARADTPWSREAAAPNASAAAGNGEQGFRSSGRPGSTMRKATNFRARWRPDRGARRSRVLRARDCPMHTRPVSRAWFQRPPTMRAPSPENAPDWCRALTSRQAIVMRSRPRSMRRSRSSTSRAPASVARTSRGIRLFSPTCGVCSHSRARPGLPGHPRPA